MSKCLEAQMPSLLQRLGMGLGEAAQTLGKVGLDRQREERLEKARAAAQKSSQEFTTSERKAGQEFTAAENIVNRQTRKDEIANAQTYGTDEREGGESFRTGEREGGQDYRTSEREASQQFTSSESSKQIDARIQAATKKAATTLKEEEFYAPVIDEFTGGVTRASKTGKIYRLDMIKNEWIQLGTGTPIVNDDTKALDKSFGEKIANRQAKAFNFDSTDFPLFKTKERAAEAIAQFRSNARKEGKVDEFDTELASKGFDYINELAGGVKNTTEEPSTKPPTEQTSASRIDTALERAKKLGMTEEEALTMMLNDPRAEMDSKEIQRRLGI
jgi:hypothetical protein